MSSHPQHLEKQRGKSRAYLFEQVGLLLLFVQLSFTDVLVKLLLGQRCGRDDDPGRSALEERMSERQRRRLGPSQRSHPRFVQSRLSHLCQSIQ